jgi:hypothetical protein
MLKPGIYPDVSEETYFGDPCATPSLSSTTAKTLVLKSAAHAHLSHPRLGGAKFVPTVDMDRGTLIHALLLGVGLSRIEVLECDDWTKKGDREVRDAYREAGKVVVTRRLYNDSMLAAGRLKEKLRARGYEFSGHSEVTLIWNETTAFGAEVPCRARLDHLLKNGRAWDLKITENASPKAIDRVIDSMGYDIQQVAYTRALEACMPHLVGRTGFEFLFCEPEPPYCITPTELRGSFRELGTRKWLDAVHTWERCLRQNRWPEYVEGKHFAEAKSWQLAAYGFDV